MCTSTSTAGVIAYWNFYRNFRAKGHKQTTSREHEGLGPLLWDFCLWVLFGSWAQTPGGREKNLRVLFRACGGPGVYPGTRFQEIRPVRPLSPIPAGARGRQQAHRRGGGDRRDASEGRRQDAPRCRLQSPWIRSLPWALSDSRRAWSESVSFLGAWNQSPVTTWDSWGSAAAPSRSDSDARPCRGEHPHDS